MMVKQSMGQGALQLEHFYKVLLKAEKERAAFLYGPVETAEEIMTIVTVMAIPIRLGRSL